MLNSAFDGARADRDILTALAVGAHGESARIDGYFRALVWQDERAYNAAQDLLRREKQRGRILDDDFWLRYFGFCEDVRQVHNVGVTAGLALLLQAGADLSPSVKFGGPAGATNKAFLGVGSALVTTTINNSGGYAAGATAAIVTSATGISTGDIIYFADSTTTQTLGSNPEAVTVSSVAGSTINFVNTPLRFAHANSTYVVRLGAPTATDMPAGTNTYKGIDTSFPTEGTVSGKATLTWQATLGTAEAQVAWNQGLIAATTGSPPNAGSGSSGVTSIPGSSTVLAQATWYPSPLTKGSSIISQQYALSVA